VRRQRGQSSVEYAVICAAIALTLGIGMADSDSMLRQLVDAFRNGYRNFTYAISISE
jgi:Flp pilus assembly pilin Flp